jgi:hypothetical protein
VVQYDVTGDHTSQRISNDDEWLLSHASQLQVFRDNVGDCIYVMIGQIKQKMLSFQSLRVIPHHQYSVITREQLNRPQLSNILLISIEAPGS